MLCSVREECGLGNPPDIFTTTSSETINALLQHKLDYKKSEMCKFIEKVKELSQEQIKEVERAVINLSFEMNINFLKSLRANGLL